MRQRHKKQERESRRRRRAVSERAECILAAEEQHAVVKRQDGQDNIRQGHERGLDCDQYPVARGFAVDPRRARQAKGNHRRNQGGGRRARNYRKESRLHAPSKYNYPQDIVQPSQ